VRVGFKLITLDGKEPIFANTNFKTSERVGKYGLDLAKLESVGVSTIREAVRARQLVVIDEIGPMEIRSATFRDAVNEAFESGVSILAMTVARSLPFTDAIKKRSDDLNLALHLDCCIEGKLGHSDSAASMTADGRPEELEDEVGESVDDASLLAEPGGGVDHSEHARPGDDAI
jgi:hypothetical protein